MKGFCQRGVAAVALLSMVVMSTACYGPFNLTKNVYHWNSNIKGNEQINDKWMRELVFFGMIIVPAYQFSALLDMFIFNSMHFWTGDSPVKAYDDLSGEHTKMARLGETTVRWIPSEKGASVTYERHGIVERRASIVAGHNGFRLIDEHGTLLSEAEYGVDDTVRFLNSDCQVVKQFTPEQLRAIAMDSPALSAEAGR